MVQIQLYVENDQGVLEEVELYKDESVTLTQSIQDVMDIEKLFTDYSRTFNVPASKTNNKFFKHFYNYNIDGFDARRKKVAELHLNYKPFKKGKIKLEGVQLKNNEPHTYKLTFFGNTITIKDLLGDTKLPVLSNLSVFNFAYTSANVETYMTNGFDQNLYSTQINDAIIFPLITHTHRLVYDSGSGFTYNVKPGSGAAGLYLSQLKPAIRVYAIIKAIEAQYNLEFSDDFFSQTNEDFYNLYLWLHKKEGGLFEDEDAEYSITGFGNLSGDVTEITGVKSASFNNDFDEDKNKRTMQVIIKTASSDPYGLVIKKDGKEFYKKENETGTMITGNVTDEGQIEATEIEPGEYTFFIIADNAATYDIEVRIENDPNSILKSTKSITFSTTLSVIAGQGVDIPSQLPDMKILDFLTGLFKMFNLTAYINDDGVVVVQPLNDYYASSTNSWDITRYLDKTETIVDSVIPYKQVNLEYENTDTFLAAAYKNIANKKWGQLLYKESSKFEGETYELKLPFEHLLYERLTDGTTGDYSEIMWGWAADSKQESTATAPVLFYPVTNATTEIQATDFSGSSITVTAPYMPSNTNGLTSTSQSLNFHSEIDEYPNDPSGPNNNTLFKTYYEDYIKDLFDKRKRITRVSAYLPLSTIEQLSLADQIIIFDRVYRINTITTNFETNKSDLELINILNPRVFYKPAATTTIPISDDIITADTTYITADQGAEGDGFEIPAVTEEIPDPTHEGNEIKNEEVVPCVVTAPTLYQVSSESGCDRITFKGYINTYGKICDFNNIDEYGFLLASTSSYLTASDDIDTLKADSNIEVRAVYRQETTLTIGEKTTIKTGLTDPATYYARFYARTTISGQYEFKDVISELITEVTECAAAKETAFYSGLSVVGGSFATVPTRDQIEDVSSYPCGAITGGQIFYHNGQGKLPVVGDLVKMNENAASNYNDYGGGTTSFTSNAVQGSNDYFSIYLFEDDYSTPTFQSAISGYAVVEYSTGEIQAVYTCPVNRCEVTKYVAGGQFGGVKGITTPGITGVAAYVSGLNRTDTADRRVAADFVGIMYSTSLSYLKDVTNPIQAINDYLKYGNTPPAVQFQIIESTNSDEDGSVTRWDSDGFLISTFVQVNKYNSSIPRYARLFIGLCGKAYTATVIVKTNAQ